MAVEIRRSQYKKTGWVMRRVSSLLALAISAALAPVLAQTSATQYSLRIDRQPLVAMLRDLSKQTGLQFVGPLVRSSAADTALVGPLSGDYTAEAALEQLLAKSHLVFKRVNENTIAIVERGSIENSRRKADAQTHSSTPGSLRWTRISAASEAATSSAGSRGGVVAGGIGSGDQLTVPVEEVLVTGTHIRGTVPVGAPLTIYTREEIDRSGAATVDQFARQMTQNFSGSDYIANADSNMRLGQLSGAGLNAFQGAAFNLRGLGPTSTLTLVNGHRLAPAGSDGSFTDISQIPLSAVDHIEVLSDSGSAIYGSDAVAGVVNLVMRKDFEGARSSLRYGEATDGGAEEITAAQLVGASWDGGNVLGSYEFSRQEGLDATERDYVASQGGPYSLIPRNRRNSVFVAGSQSLAPNTNLVADASYSEREFSSDSTIASSLLTRNLLNVGDAQQFGGNATIEQALRGDWDVRITGSYFEQQQVANSNVNQRFGAFSQQISGTLEADSSIASADLIATGSIFEVGGGSVKTAVGANFRREDFQSQTLTITPVQRLLSGVADRDREVTSVFAEFFVPIIGARNAMPWVERLELSAAVRHDEYDDFGDTTNPKVGLSWAVDEGLIFRGTYGTSFRAPGLQATGLPTTFLTQNIPNPAAAGGVTDTLIISGGNPGLDAETSQSYTFGLDWNPTALPRLATSVTYFNIDFRDRLSQPPVTILSGIFSDPALASFVDLSPSLDAVQAAFADPNFGGDLAGRGAAGVTAIFDARTANIASSRQSGVDFSAKYRQPLAAGDLAFSMSVSRLIKNDFRSVDESPGVALLNSFAQPPKYRGRASVAWVDRLFSSTLSVNYLNSYENSLVVPAESIDSWTTADLNVSYKAPASSGLLAGVAVSLSVLNLTDEEPPFVRIPVTALLPGQNSIPFDPANAAPVGRLISFQLSKDW